MAHDNLRCHSIVPLFILFTFVAMLSLVTKGFDQFNCVAAIATIATCIYS